MLVKDIYKKNPGKIADNVTVEEAFKELLKQDFNCFLVTNDHDDLVGILCLQHILSAVVPTEFQENLNLADAMYKPHFFHELCTKVKHKKVKDIMQTEFLTVDPESTVMKVAADFVNKNLYSVPIPVIENGKVIGIITRSEIKKALARGMDISS